jgi:hypothetical protein
MTAEGLPPSVTVTPMQVAQLPLSGHRIFLSSSIPDASRWDGAFSPLDITDAVAAFARSVLTMGGTLVTAAHPTVAPLLLYVSREFPSKIDQPPAVIVYQSRLFEDVLSEETYELARGGFAELRWTAAHPGESTSPDNRDQSLQQMREEMLRETSPVAAIFIGGMEGIVDEHRLFGGIFPTAPRYALTMPGGEAASLVQSSPPALISTLDSTLSYPTIAWQVVQDVIETIAGG